jgi:hypothetical protein
MPNKHYKNPSSHQTRPDNTSSIPPEAGPALGLGSIIPTKARSNSSISASCSSSTQLFFRLITLLESNGEGDSNGVLLGELKAVVEALPSEKPGKPLKCLCNVAGLVVVVWGEGRDEVLVCESLEAEVRDELKGEKAVRRRRRDMGRVVGIVRDCFVRS